MGLVANLRDLDDILADSWPPRQKLVPGPHALHTLVPGMYRVHEIPPGEVDGDRRGSVTIAGPALGWRYARPASNQPGPFTRAVAPDATA